ncbi:MAG: tetratricopeptide repeat protein, partial [Flavobacteriales bacterium]|nr:tetratricopeptide repeat protein [Flavobacteriales bacterium]
MADSLIGQSNFSQALKVIKNGLSECDECADETLATLYHKLAKVQFLIENYGAAHMAHVQSVRYSERSKLPNIMMRSYVSIAEYYRNRQLHNSSIKYFNKAKKLSASNKIDDPFIAEFYNRYAALLTEIGDSPDSVLYYSRKSINISELTKDDFLKASSLNEMAFVIEHYRDKQDAISFYNRACELWIANGDRRSAANGYVNLSRVYYSLENFQQAKEIAEKGLDIVGEDRWSSVLIDLYERKVYACMALEEYEEALNAHFEFHEQGLRYKEKEWSYKMIEVSTKLKIEEKLSKINKSKDSTQDKLEKKEIEESELKIILLVGGLFLIVLL